MDNNMNNVLLIKSLSKSYSVTISEKVENLLTSKITNSNYIVILDANVALLHPEFITHYFSHSKIYTIEATEANKSMQEVMQILAFMSENNCTRDTTLYAIGGGITGDLAAFCAGIYQRGIPWVSIPTTLLSMSDSCIGGKCGVNFQTLKNLVGVIHAPNEVLLWPGFLKTLAPLELKSGLAEILKHCLLTSQEEFHNLSNYCAKNKDILSNISQYIRQSLQVKKQIIEEDEFENGSRLYLNYGHSFAHALESLSDNKIPHGLAVAWGIDLINYISYKNKILSFDIYTEIHEFISTNFSHTCIFKIDIEKLFLALRKDKKKNSQGLRFICLRDWGKPEINYLKINDCFTEFVQDYINNYSSISFK